MIGGVKPSPGGVGISGLGVTIRGGVGTPDDGASVAIGGPETVGTVTEGAFVVGGTLVVLEVLVVISIGLVVGGWVVLVVAGLVVGAGVGAGVGIGTQLTSVVFAKVSHVGAARKSLQYEHCW